MANASPVQTPSASAFGVSAPLSGNGAVPPTPTSAFPPGGTSTAPDAGVTDHSIVEANDPVTATTFTFDTDSVLTFNAQQTDADGTLEVGAVVLTEQGTVLFTFGHVECRGAAPQPRTAGASAFGTRALGGTAAPHAAICSTAPATQTRSASGVTATTTSTTNA
ncbi:MAG TPA: hypothetical protein VGJ28_01870, partial [Micromonosporaceae bacterium]